MGKFFLLLFLVIFNAWCTDYPKIYSSLGNQLFDANTKFKPFLIDSVVGLKVYEFNQLSEQIRLNGIYLDSKSALNPFETQQYLLSLRELEKKYKEISYLLHQKLLHSIEENNYEDFHAIFITITNDILNRPNLMKEIISFYRQNRHNKTIPLLENILNSSTTFNKQKNINVNEVYTFKHLEGEKIELSMWQDNADAANIQLDWQDAIEYCQNLTLGGFEDWTLPDKTNLFKFFFSRPELKNHTEDLYWSASEESDTIAYRVYFNHNGSVSQASNITSDSKNEKWFVRCYRHIR